MADEGGADEEDEAAWAGAAEVAIDLLRNALLGVSGGGPPATASNTRPPGTASAFFRPFPRFSPRPAIFPLASEGAIQSLSFAVSILPLH